MMNEFQRPTFTKIKPLFKITMIGLLLACFFWLVETFIHLSFFDGGDFYHALLPADPNELWMRSFTSVIIFLLYCITAYMYSQKQTLLKRLTLTFEVFDSLHSGVVLTDKRNNILFVNKKYSQITGYSQSEVLGKNPSVVKSGKQNKAFYKELWTCLNEKGYWEGEMWNRKKTGELFAEWISITVIPDKHQKTHYHLAVLADISSRKKAEKMIEHYAYFDPLTNLPNRRLFNQKLDQVIKLSKRENKKFALLFIDLDDFKPINDKLGHHIGDQYLCKIAAFLQSELRESDLLARLGGDEFIIMLSAIHSSEDAAFFTDKLYKAMQETKFTIENHSLEVKASIGWAIYPDDESNVNALIHQADLRMYDAKNRRKKNNRDV